MSAGTCACALPCALDRQSTRLQERIEALARVYTVGAQELTLAFLYMALALAKHTAAGANRGCRREVGGWGRDPFSRNFMTPTPRRKWYLTTGRRFH